MLEVLGGSGQGSLIGTVVILALALVVVLLAVRFARTVRPDAAAAAAVDNQLGRSGSAWRHDAAEHAAAGRWRDAVRCHYRALLADLAAAALVEEVAGRTTGEYLAAVRDDVPASAAAFAEATQGFERAWYTDHDVTAGDADAIASHADAALRAAGVRARVGVHR